MLPVLQSKRAMEANDELNGFVNAEERFLATWRRQSKGKRGARLHERDLTVSGERKEIHPVARWGDGSGSDKSLFERAVGERH